MVKVTPDPPTFRKALLSDNDATRRALGYSVITECFFMATP